jgi:hypothetical protein
LVPVPEKPTRRRFLVSVAAASVPFCLSAMGEGRTGRVRGVVRQLGFGGVWGRGRGGRTRRERNGEWRGGAARAGKCPTGCSKNKE